LGEYSSTFSAGAAAVMAAAAARGKARAVFSETEAAVKEEAGRVGAAAAAADGANAAAAPSYRKRGANIFSAFFFSRVGWMQWRDGSLLCVCVGGGGAGRCV
jgi:hypothetical protein